MRKQILNPDVTNASPGLDVAAIATAMISSEAERHPIELAFDGQRGPGGTRWIAGRDGPQTLILKFDQPQKLHQITLEIEETEVSRTQEVQLAVSVDQGQTYLELLRQEFNFAPPGTTFEREVWTVHTDPATHLRLEIKPDKSGRPCRASLTALVLQ